MDIVRIEKLWGDISQTKMKTHALDYLITKLASSKHERVIMRLLWGLDILIEKRIFLPREIALALVRSDQLRVDASPFFQCAFKLLLKLIFFLDYKNNREVFNKSIEKSSQFPSFSESDRSTIRLIDPVLELIKLLLSREICLMPAYFAMHELIRSFPSEHGNAPHMSIKNDVEKFMDSFARPACLLYCQIHRSIKPICGIAPATAPAFRVDSSNLVLTSIKGAMRYPEFLTTAQLPLLSSVLGQLRCTELTAGMLESPTGKSKTRSVGLELALVHWIVEIMELTEGTDDTHWVHTIFEHLISVVITFMLSSTIRFNEIVVKLNEKLEGRTWPKSSHYVMWFVLNATSGFIGKNMLTDFVPCLRLFDILFPDAEDPDRAMELQTPRCGKKCEQHFEDMNMGGEVSFTRAADGAGSEGCSHERIGASVGECTNVLSLPETRETASCDSRTAATPVELSVDEEVDEYDCLTDTSAEESECENLQEIIPPTHHQTTACHKLQGRLIHLTTAPVCLWQHVLRKSRLGHDHLPRVMPPVLRPIEARISCRMRNLIDSTTALMMNADANSGSVALVPALTARLTWKQLFVILNAYSTDNEVSPVIQRLVDMFWFGGEGDPSNNLAFPYSRLWPKLLNNGTVSLPYGLVARGRLEPLPHHLIRCMSIHLRMLVLHLLLQKFASLQYSDQLTTPAVTETMCRILTCREVEPSNVNRILHLLSKPQPTWPVADCSSGAPTVQSPAAPAAEQPSAVTVCHLVSTLLDTLGHRLADVLLPEVRMQTIISLTNLIRLWTAWSQQQHHLPDPSEKEDARSGQSLNSRNEVHEVPFELFYMLEWTVCKFARSVQAPDCAIYGLCSSITPTALAQAQAAAAAVVAAASASTTAGNAGVSAISAPVFPGSASGTAPAASSAPSNAQPTAAVTGNVGPTRVSSSTSGAKPLGVSGVTTQGIGQNSSEASFTMSSASDIASSSNVSTVLVNTLTSYPLLMTDQLELNRFVLFSMLQIYYAFDLDEVSGMKAFLVEQIRTMRERCGPNSLTDLPRLISNRLPEFLALNIRQRASPSFSSAGQFGTDETNSADKTANLSQILLLVQEEYKRLSDGETTWTQIANHGSLLFCVIFRYLLARGTVPRSAFNSVLHSSMASLNSCLCTLCDYVLACLTVLSSNDECMAQKCTDTLCEFCLTWRVVPLDRFLLFLLTHTNYQNTQLDAVNQIIVHIFTKCDKISAGIGFLSTIFLADSSADHSSNCTHLGSRRYPHPFPLASRDWPSCVKRLHELIPDQWFNGTDKAGDSSLACSKGAAGGDSSDCRHVPNLPILYGHLLLRLLPLLEVILSQFLETRLPLLYLIPFCQAVAPLFRFHQRPVNACYVILREHWQLAPPNLGSTGIQVPASLSVNEARLKWCIDRLRVQLITHCILSKHQLLAQAASKNRKVRTSAELSGKQSSFQQSGQQASGLFTPKAWFELCNTVDMASKTYDYVRAKHSDLTTNPTSFANAESELDSLLCNWFTSLPRFGEQDYLPALLDPILLSARNHGLSGHPAAWRPWRLEEGVSIQAAALYCASVEIMSSSATPSDFVSSVAGVLNSRLTDEHVADCLNIIGALSAVLPSVYRLALCQFSVGLCEDSILTDPTPDCFWSDPSTKYDLNADSVRWRRSSRSKRHIRLLDCSLSNEPNLLQSGNRGRPPVVASEFFTYLLPPHLSSSSSKTPASNRPIIDCEASINTIGKQACLLKASLWHAIWSHANTTFLTALPTLFSQLILPLLHNEAQLLMAFYLVAPLMGSLHAERAPKLVDLTAELYRAVWQVDSALANEEICDESIIHVDADGLPLNTGVPLVHVDTIADLLYHIKYMYVGNGVLDKVRPLLPQLRPSLRKRLKFILSASEVFPPSSQKQREQKQSKVFPGQVSNAVYEGRVYLAAARPPMNGEDF
ncbi:unnamed protein product [Calicophoron daubneyi]|uniref:Mediator of RNA polymerase II transcription subunit 23 n=1 Tax=Calicophoron daubneyi TaxID=300641 RepID=A0AAV2TAV1_CALDB